MPVGRLEEINLRKVLSAQAVSDKQKLLWSIPMRAHQSSFLHQDVFGVSYTILKLAHKMQYCMAANMAPPNGRQTSNPDAAAAAARAWQRDL